MRWRKSIAALAVGVAVFGVAACDSDNDTDPDQVNEPSTEIDPDQINEP